jgi:hypothetical protein
VPRLAILATGAAGPDRGRGISPEQPGGVMVEINRTEQKGPLKKTKNPKKLLTLTPIRDNMNS